MKRFSEFKTYAREEFISHLPFTLTGVAAGVAFVLATRMGVGGQLNFGEEEFHLAHMLHIFFSGAAGVAIFKSYRDSLFKAIPVSVVSAVTLCTASDILIPYVGLSLFGYTAGLHLCILEHPAGVVASAVAGVGMGLCGFKFFGHCNREFHLLHILIATAASTLYLMSFVPVVDARALAVIGLTLFTALVIPCIAGDIAVPLIFVRIRDEYLHEKVHHSGCAGHSNHLDHSDHSDPSGRSH
jgi:hypothetical protein